MKINKFQKGDLFGSKEITHDEYTKLYGDFVYRFKKKDVGKSSFSKQVIKLIKLYNRIGYCYNLDIMQLTACLVDNPITMITVDSYSFLFNCMAVVLRLFDSLNIKLS